jgi:hypothetical protein
MYRARANNKATFNMKHRMTVHHPSHAIGSDWDIAKRHGATNGATDAVDFRTVGGQVSQCSVRVAKWFGSSYKMASCRPTDCCSDTRTLGPSERRETKEWFRTIDFPTARMLSVPSERQFRTIDFPTARMLSVPSERQWTRGWSQTKLVSRQ